MRHAGQTALVVDAHFTVGTTAIALAATILLAACAPGSSGPKQNIGTGAGAIAGGILGSQIGSGKGRLAAIAAGALLGGIFGGEIGRSLDEADRLRAQRTAKQSLEYEPTGTTSSWVNPDSGNSGTFTPSRTIQSAQGSPCREYQTTVTIGGRTETAFGRACREADGSWTIVN